MTHSRSHNYKIALTLTLGTLGYTCVPTQVKLVGHDFWKRCHLRTSLFGTGSQQSDPFYRLLPLSLLCNRAAQGFLHLHGNWHLCSHSEFHFPNLKTVLQTDVIPGYRQGDTDDGNKATTDLRCKMHGCPSSAQELHPAETWTQSKQTEKN